MKNKFKEPLHILIDGSDKKGKTTVIQMLSRKLDLPIVKMPNMPEYIEKNQAEEFSKLFNETIVQFSEYDFIMDRGFTSSIVYSKVFDRKFDLAYIKNIEKRLKPQIFILTGDRFGHDEIVEVNLNSHQIDLGYIELAEREGYTVINVNGKTPIEICNTILEKLSLEEESQA